MAIDGSTTRVTVRTRQRRDITRWFRTPARVQCSMQQMYIAKNLSSMLVLGDNDRLEAARTGPRHLYAHRAVVGEHCVGGCAVAVVLLGRLGLVGSTVQMLAQLSAHGPFDAGLPQRPADGLDFPLGHQTLDQLVEKLGQDLQLRDARRPLGLLVLVPSSIRPGKGPLIRTAAAQPARHHIGSPRPAMESHAKTMASPALTTPDPVLRRSRGTSSTLTTSCCRNQARGHPGYAAIIEAVADPTHEEHAHILNRPGRASNPIARDLGEIDQPLAAIKPIFKTVSA